MRQSSQAVLSTDPHQNIFSSNVAADRRHLGLGGPNTWVALHRGPFVRGLDAILGAFGPISCCFGPFGPILTSRGPFWPFLAVMWPLTGATQELVAQTHGDRVALLRLGFGFI